MKLVIQGVPLLLRVCDPVRGKCGDVTFDSCTVTQLP
jgi:hypothetical protein